MWVLGPDYPTAILWGGKRYAKAGQHRDGTYSSLTAAMDHAEIVVTNYEVLGQRSAELLAVPWQYLILDEAHELKQGFMRPLVKRDGTLQKRRFEHALELALAVHARGGTVWELTATPIRDRRRDLWAQLRIVLPFDKSVGRSSWNWLHYYCGAKRDHWGGLDTTGESNTEELAAFLLQHFVLATRAEVAHELPAVQRDVRLVTLDRENRAVKHGGGIEEAIARSAASKEPMAAELACDYLVGRGKVVVVTSRRALAHSMLAAIQRASKALPPAVKRTLWLHTVTGETPIPERQREVNEFNAREDTACLVATMDSIQTSIDIHQTDALVFAALPYTPYGVDQMEGRTGRLGGRPVTIHYLIAENSIDERVRELLLDKLDAVERVGTDTQGAATGAATALRNIRDEEAVLAGLRAWLEEGDENG